MKSDDFPVDVKHIKKEFHYSVAMVCLCVRSRRKFVFFSELVSSDLVSAYQKHLNCFSYLFTFQLIIRKSKFRGNLERENIRR